MELDEENSGKESLGASLTIIPETGTKHERFERR